MLQYIAVLVLIIYGVYYWLTKNNDHWKKRGIPFIQPRLLVGNMGEMVAMKKSIGVVVTELYKKSKDHQYIGMFNLRQPVLLLRDVDMIKTVLVKDFNKFHDNVFEVDEHIDPVISKNPFFLKGDRWKIIRNQLTPLLTVAKMKPMFPLIQQISERMVKYLEEEPEATGNDGLEAKELALKFTTDNVATCAFGLEGHSFDDPKAEFRTMAEEFFDVTTFATIKYFFLMIFPGLTKIIRNPVGRIEISDKFKAILAETVKYRKDNKVVRNDFLDSLIELDSKPTPLEYSDDYMVAHAFTFFVDGSDTSAISLSFALCEIALNLDVQNKFKQEIDEVLSKYEGRVTFEAIQEMSYLDAIFLETLRKYPSLMVMNRLCTEEANLPIPGNSGETLKVEKGTHVFLPILALHRDPEYYPNPEVFDPDRFTKNAKHPLRKNCFYGFGDGPRICLGQRFAQMQIKACLIAVVSNFEIRVNKKTKIPIEIEPKLFTLAADGGIWLNFYKRDKKG